MSLIVPLPMFFDLIVYTLTPKETLDSPLETELSGGCESGPGRAVFRPAATSARHPGSPQMPLRQTIGRQV
jgi:hypothetical protein